MEKYKVLEEIVWNGCDSCNKVINSLAKFIARTFEYCYDWGHSASGEIYGAYLNLNFADKSALDSTNEVLNGC